MNTSKNGFAGRLARLFAVAILAGLLSALAVLVLSARLMVGLDLPASAPALLAGLALCLGSFVSGFILARLLRQGGLLCGLGCGVFWGVALVVTAFVCNHPELGRLLLAKLTGIFASGLLGGLCGVVAAQKPKKRPGKAKR